MRNKRVAFTFDQNEKIDKEKVLAKAKEETEELFKRNDVDITKDSKGNVIFSLKPKK